MYKWILLILLIPTVFAFDNETGMLANLSHYVTQDNKNAYLSEVEITKDLTQKYCNQLNDSMFTLLVIVFFMWLLDPWVKRKLSNIKTENSFLRIMYDEDGLWMIYKMIGLGLIVLTQIIIWRIGG
jgi:hypothetical protein